MRSKFQNATALLPTLVALVFLLLFTALCADLMHGIRAFAYGESLWSKSEKQVQIDLLQFTYSRDSSLLADAARHLAVLESLRNGRIQLTKPHRNDKDVTAELEQGGIAAEDIPSLIRVYRAFGSGRIMSRAFAAWQATDEGIDALAAFLSDPSVSGHTEPTDPRATEFRGRLVDIDRNLTKQATTFSQAINSASSRAELILLLINALAAVVLMSAAGLISRKFGRNLLESQIRDQAQKKENEELETRVRQRTVQLESEAHERQQTTQALEAALGRFELVVDSCGDGLWDLQNPGQGKRLSDPLTPFWFSNQFRQLLGFCDENDFPNLLGSWSSRLHPDDLEPALTALTRHVEDLSGRTPYDVNYRLKLKTGEYRWFFAHGLTYRNQSGLPLRSAGSLRDVHDERQHRKDLEQEIHERKLAEMDLQWKTAFLEAQGDATVDGVLVVNPENKAIFRNKAFSAMWKIPQYIADERDDTVQLHYKLSLTKNPDRVLKQVLYLYDHPQESSRDEIELKDGRILDRYSAPVLGKDGTHYGRIWTFRDITEQRQNEEALRCAKEAAEVANRAKSEFLANMSHEIRTPLNGVIGMTDLALDSQPAAEQREYLETIKLSADSLLAVINDILDYSKIEAGKMEIEALDFDLRECVEEALRPLALRADQKGIELLCDIAPDLPEIMRGDCTRLRQTLLNLVGNAIKFTAVGEVCVRVVAEIEESDVGNIHFVVSDTGIGIPSEKQEAIFTAFAQADTSTTRQYGGTGLGLSICRSLVSMMDGNIWLESEAGHGSKFHFTVRMKVVKKTPNPKVTLSCSKCDDQRILIVDDNPTNRKILHGFSTHWGLRACAVESGEKALAELLFAKDTTDPYRLILTDMQMPNMDGFQLVEKIREMPGLTTAPIMMLTSVGHWDDRERCNRLGIISCLLKPIQKQELLAAILKVLDPDHPSLRTVQDAPQQPMPTRSALRILLAEDNRINQAVASRMLAKMGHSLVIANNGAEALLQLDRQTFDLILMDIQMPEMDGLTATRKIRERELQTRLRLPIIAMTAHAMKGDRELCLCAGMDGYVSKPINARELGEAIADVVSRRGPGLQTLQREPAADNQPTWDIARTIQGLGGDENLTREILELFLTEGPEHLERLRCAIVSKNAKDVESIAHSLKGELGYMGNPEIATKARELEEIGRRRDLEQATNLFAAFEADLSAMLESVRNLDGIKQPERLGVEAPTGQ